jgi:hypothetical protein
MNKLINENEDDELNTDWNIFKVNSLIRLNSINYIP